MTDSKSGPKYSTGPDPIPDRDEQSSDEPTQLDLDEPVEKAVEEFTTDSLWMAALEPEDVPLPESSEPSTAEKGTEYRNNSLYMTEGTSTTEVIEFLRDCIRDPVTVGDKVVWNFSTHKIDDEAIQEVAQKNQNKFLIPYQVTGVWGFIFSLLPEEIREAEVLVYDPDENEYRAYRSLYRTTANERIEQIRKDLSRRMVRESGQDLGLID